MAMKIGCSDLHYALYKIDPETKAESWATPVPAAGVMSLNINMNPSLATAFFDDAPGESAATLGNIEVEIQKSELTSAEKAIFLGHKLDKNGALITSGDDVAPELAIGFKNLRSDGTYRYVWMLRGKFSEPEDNNTTKGESVEFQNETFTGRFMKVENDVEIEIEGSTPEAPKTIKKKPIKTEIREGDAGADSIIPTWFSKVYLGAVKTV